MKRDIISVDLGKDLKEHVIQAASEKKLTPSLFVRAILKKHTKFKEKSVL